MRFTSWYTVLMPARSASRGERGRTDWPSRRVLPASRSYTPVSTLMSVLLPAPFSPMSAWISPARTVKSTPCKARTPGKLFSNPRISSKAASAIGELPREPQYLRLGSSAAALAASKMPSLTVIRLGTLW